MNMEYKTKLYDIFINHIKTLNIKSKWKLSYIISTLLKDNIYNDKKEVIIVDLENNNMDFISINGNGCKDKSLPIFNNIDFDKLEYWLSCNI